MGETETTETDQPITKSWSEDWAKAEEQASAFAEEQSTSAAEEAGEQTDDARQNEEQGLQVESRPEDETTEGSETSGEEGGHVAGDGDVSQQGGIRRGQEEVLSSKDRLEAVKKEAADLGLTFEGQTILTSERAKFREEKRNMRGKLAAEREHFQQEAQEATARLEAEAGRSRRLEQAIEANDPDGIAQAMGVESWNHLSEQVLKRQMNPEHKELMRLRREKQEAEVQAEESKKVQARQAQHNKQQEAREKYRTEIGLKVAKIKKYASFSDDPMFVAGVLKHQEKHWDGEETISLEEASELAMKDARLIYDTLHKRFGGQAASQPENQSSSETQNAEKSGRKTPPKTVSHSEVADASSVDNSGDFDHAAWVRKWSKPIKDSVAH